MTMDLTPQGLPSLLLSIACSIAPGGEAFCYAGWSGDDDDAPGVRLSGARYVELPKRSRKRVLRHLEHACVGYRGPGSGYDLRQFCACGLTELALVESSHAWLVLPLQSAGLRFGVIALAVDAQCAVAQSVAASCAEKLGPALGAVFELYSCCQRLQRTLPDAMATALQVGLRRTLEATQSAPPVAERALRSCEPVVLDAAAVSSQAAPPSSELAESPVLSACAELPTSRPGLMPGLSKREQEIGALLVAGYAAVNAAAVLGLSEHTVRTYVRRLYRKLGVSNRVELVRLYMECLEQTEDPDPAELTPARSA
jgi:DNA-binding CsgD family transcriptional regulator